MIAVGDATPLPRKRNSETIRSIVAALIVSKAARSSAESPPPAQGPFLRNLPRRSPGTAGRQDHVVRPVDTSRRHGKSAIAVIEPFASCAFFGRRLEELS
jgi:hypothetical protein